MTRGAAPLWRLLLCGTFVCAPWTARAQTAAQRTMGSAPPNATTTNTQPDAVDSALRQYRTMWQKMSPAQQKAFLDSGGSTPEQYERMLRAKGQSTPPASTTQAARPASTDPRSTADALDSLTTSLQDLNAIRDGNLVRVQKDGCPPEVTSRLVDLRGRLRRDEADLAGVEAPGSVAAPAKERPNAADPIAIASDWYKQPQQAEKESKRSTGPVDETKESKLLADVLTAGPNTGGPARRVDPKSPEAQQRQKGLEEEIARLKAEIAQLSGACATLKR